MTKKRIFLLSFLVTLALWCWFSWPLPRYVVSGIPAAAHTGPADVQPFTPGDHLQLMYYCWLAGDMVSGNTPLFYNLYEFNTGEKKDCYRPDSYYFPFSLVYAATAWAGGRAFGWNLTGFLTLWLTYLLTWLLVRRYAKPDWLAGCAALIAVTLPFRWINLCGGSPAGFAMMWIPAIFLGIDLAVRESKPSGGVMAGVALFLASWTDSHVFFFGTLAVPCWTLIAVSADFKSDLNWRNTWQNIFAALLPIPIMLGLALSFPTLMQMLSGTDAASQHVAATVGARIWREVALYSPSPAGFVDWFSAGTSTHIYIGFSAFVFLAVGGICLLVDALRGQRDSRRRLLVMILLIAGIAGVMALALGTNSPYHAIFLRTCRKLIPPYALIRQPAKIFCLMPPLLAVAAGLGLGAIFVHLKNSRAKILVALLFCAAVTGEYALRVHPIISILDQKQGAYEAVAKDAVLASKPPHALVVPLWPGDSHYSSAYQYYASLYRVRMVNGYNPFVSKSYLENVFRRYESVNQGWLTDEQLNELARRGIGYLILHEDLFPEKVSPFSVGWTLKHLFANQRLELLKQDGRAWAFKLLPKPIEKSRSNTDRGAAFGCARHWQAEACLPTDKRARGNARIIHDSFPSHVSYVVLDKPESSLLVPALRVAPDAQLHWMLRARGEGALLAETTADKKIISRDLLDISADEWQWFDIPINNLETFAPIGLKIEHYSGAVECDQMLLADGEWISPAAGQTVILPAPYFFHAGYTSLSDNTVVFEKEHEAEALIFYGQKLPLEKGLYRVELVFDSRAPKGVLLGQFNIKRHERDSTPNWIPVVAGAQSLTTFSQSQNLPMYLESIILGNGNLKIKHVKLTRLK